MNFCHYYYFSSKISRRLYLPTLLTLPIAIGSLFFRIVPDPLYRVEGQGMWNFYVEFLIRRSKSSQVSRLRESKAAGVLLFSVLNACVMYGFVKKISMNFWFTPLRLKDTKDFDNDVTNCEKVHGKLNCTSYWINVKLYIKVVNIYLIS